jgi:hypothetical protein
MLTQVKQTTSNAETAKQTTGNSCSYNADTGEDVCVQTVTFLFLFYFGHRKEIK